MKIELTKKEFQTLVHGLRVAAEKFEDNAQVIMESAKKDDSARSIYGYEHLAEQFMTQAAETKVLANKLEDGITCARCSKVMSDGVHCDDSTCEREAIADLIHGKEEVL